MSTILSATGLVGFSTMEFQGLCRRCERLELEGEIPLVQTADSYLEEVLTGTTIYMKGGSCGDSE